MCTAVYNNEGILGRTVDRTGSSAEHFVFCGGGFAGGMIRNAFGEIWIDGMNEYGLTAALLNYRKEVREEKIGRRKISPAVLIRELIENCKNTDDAGAMLREIELSCGEPEMYPHYMICDTDGGCIVYENGKIYKNPVGVLANSPSFGEMLALHDRMAAEERIYWDHTSESRFLRMAHLRKRTPLAGIDGIYAALNSVSVPMGFDPRENYRTVLRNVMAPERGLYCTAEGCSGCVRCVRLGKKGVFSVNECEVLTLS